MPQRKFIIVEPSSEVRTVDEPEDAAASLKTLQDAVGGYIEVVRPKDRYLPWLLLIVNEEGLLTGLPTNLRFPQFVGPVVCATDGEVEYTDHETGEKYVEHDIIGLDDEQAKLVAERLKLKFS